MIGCAPVDVAFAALQQRLIDGVLLQGSEAAGSELTVTGCSSMNAGVSSRGHSPRGAAGPGVSPLGDLDVVLAALPVANHTLHSENEQQGA